MFDDEAWALLFMDIWAEVERDLAFLQGEMDVCGVCFFKERWMVVCVHVDGARLPRSDLTLSTG